MCNKCSLPADIVIKPDGVNELDPCIYKDIAKYKNITITISRCSKCGNTEISWERQDDTEEMELE